MCPYFFQFGVKPNDTDVRHIFVFKPGSVLGNVYRALFYVGKKQKRISLDTDSLQIAKEKVRQLESALYRG
jgi:hypothetical protein